MPITLLIGAEGVSEMTSCAWLREATPEEVATLRDLCGAERFRDLSVDGIGRPYFPMTVLEDAPAWAKEKAARSLRVKRLEP